MENIEPNDWHSSKSDQYKAMAEYAKHLSTMSAGAIVLIATFMEKLFKQPTAKGASEVAIVALLTTLVASLLAMFVAAVVFPRPNRKAADKELSFMATLFIVATMSFVVGIGAIAWFAVENW